MLADKLCLNMRRNKKKDIKIILHSPNDKILIADRVSDLLPFVFVSNDLKRF